MTTRKGSGGKSTFNSGYLVMYTSVGIPEAVFSSIVDKIRLGCEGSSIRLGKVTRHDGYAWMPMKLPTDDPILAYVIDSEGDEVEVGKLLDLIAESKSSMKGYGTITLRLKQSRSRTAPSNNKFSLAGTLSAIQVTDIMSLSSPPLYNKVKGMLVDMRISQGLSELLASITSGGAEEEQEVGSEEEKAEEESKVGSEEQKAEEESKDRDVVKKEVQEVEKAETREEKKKVGKDRSEAE